MKPKFIFGKCYCGRVRFKALPPTLYQVNCHCANCRRAAGAQAVAWITVNRDHFMFTQGRPKRFRTKTGAWRMFCGHCGSSLTYENDRRPDETDITTGSLDHPEQFPPTRDIFADEKLPWVALVRKARS